MSTTVGIYWSSKELPPHCHDYVKAKPVAVVLGSRRTEFFTDVWMFATSDSVSVLCSDSATLTLTLRPIPECYFVDWPSQIMASTTKAATYLRSKTVDLFSYFTRYQALQQWMNGVVIHWRTVWCQLTGSDWRCHILCRRNAMACLERRHWRNPSADVGDKPGFRSRHGCVTIPVAGWRLPWRQSPNLHDTGCGAYHWLRRIAIFRSRALEKLVNKLCACAMTTSGSGLLDQAAWGGSFGLGWPVCDVGLSHRMFWLTCKKGLRGRSRRADCKTHRPPDAPNQWRVSVRDRVQRDAVGYSAIISVNDPTTRSREVEWPVGIRDGDLIRHVTHRSDSVNTVPERLY